MMDARTGDASALAKVSSWPKAVFFDLDGTLIDSAPDIAIAVNILLDQAGHAPLSVPEVRSMIGHGVKKLVERAFAARETRLEGDALDAMTDRMMDIYKDHLTGETCFMTGALAALEWCKASGMATGVVTNKPEGFTRTILADMGFASLVDVVVGGDTGPERKPAPDMLFHACHALGLTPADTLMVGDSPADIGAAQAAQIQSIAVHGGYTNIPVTELGANIVINTLESLAAAVASLQEVR